MLVLSEEQLLDFDRSRLAGWSQEREDQALAEHRELFLNHLTIAMHLDFWIGNLDEQPSLHADQEEFTSALREVAAHLRQGDYLPDGVLYRETMALQ
jgi:hypothetical protein